MRDRDAGSTDGNPRNQQGCQWGNSAHSITYVSAQRFRKSKIRPGWFRLRFARCLSTKNITMPARYFRSFYRHPRHVSFFRRSLLSERYANQGDRWFLVTKYMKNTDMLKLLSLSTMKSLTFLMPPELCPHLNKPIKARNKSTHCQYIHVCMLTSVYICFLPFWLVSLKLCNAMNGRRRA